MVSLKRAKRLHHHHKTRELTMKASVTYKLIMGLSILMLIAGWQLGYSDDAQVVAKSSVATAKVELGDFSIKIEGYGSLQSVNKRLITATSNALVDEIKLKAGAVVEADTVILILKNPILSSQLRQALAKLKNSKTQKRQVRLLQQREMLDNESLLSQLQADAEISMLQVEAERALAKSGIISGIRAKKNELAAKQLFNRVRLETFKTKKLIAMQAEAIAIQDDLIAQARDDFNVAKKMVEQLSVKAGIKGVIQRLSLSLGQNVSIGTELALIGSLSPLVAEIQVPQLQAHMITVGMKSQISTITNQLIGEVVRVDPVVNNGAVQVDVELITTEASIKPMQLVDATIFAQVKKDVHYIKTPAGVTENTSVSMFKLGVDNKASRVEVKFGKASGPLIQVLSGLETGDEVIISKLDIDKDITQIKLKI